MTTPTAPTPEELAARKMERIEMATAKLSKAPANSDHDYTERHANDHKKHERIWLLPNDGEQVTWCDMDALEDGSGQEYVRADLIASQAAQIAELTADNEQLNATFDLRYKADARAIKQWHEVTGRTMSMPDQADLCATRSDKTYASMLEDGATDALRALDAARREARTALQPKEPANG